MDTLAAHLQFKLIAIISHECVINLVKVFGSLVLGNNETQVLGMIG